MSVSIYISKGEDIRFDVLKKYNIEESDISFNEYGKPITNKGVFFSISHSLDYFVIAVSDFNIGIDIEYERDLDYINISKRIFKSEILDKKTFFKTWVKYEAYVKYLGLSMFSNKAKLEDIKNVSYTSIDIIDNLYMGLITNEPTEIEVILW